MKADTATLADVKLVLTAPIHIQTKRSGYSKAQVDFVSARMKFIDRATSTTWTGTVEAARRLHAEVVGELGAGQGELDGCFQEAELVAGVVASARELDGGALEHLQGCRAFEV